MKRLAVVIAALVFVLLAAWHRAPAPVAPAVLPAAMARPPSAPGVTGLLSTPLPRQQLVRRYQLADHTLCSYAQASQYPPGSRPMAQNADQAYPNRPVTEANAMRDGNGTLDGAIHVQTSQSRVYLASGEAVTLSLRAVDEDGAVLPLVVTRAMAGGIRYGAQRAQAVVAVDFSDAGTGAATGVLAPAQTGLATFDGTIRTQVEYVVNGKQGVVSFDVIYSPVLPAVWTGPVREALENGSLMFYLPAQVQVAGRYIVTGRVDDARGVPVALLTFNDLLPAGPNDVRLAAFGKLLRDGAPTLPLTLRDVEGFLLRENVDPDRALMPRLEGVVATSRSYPVDSFSAAPYDGEERSRYLAEFGKDVARARDDLLRADPPAALPVSSCAAR